MASGSQLAHFQSGQSPGWLTCNCLHNLWKRTLTIPAGHAAIVQKGLGKNWVVFWVCFKFRQLPIIEIISKTVNHFKLSKVRNSRNWGAFRQSQDKVVHKTHAVTRLDYHKVQRATLRCHASAKSYEWFYSSLTVTYLLLKTFSYINGKKKVLYMTVIYIWHLEHVALRVFHFALIYAFLLLDSLRNLSSWVSQESISLWLLLEN